MGKARLIRAAFLVGLLALVLRTNPSNPVDSDERSEWKRFNERCGSDSLRTLDATATVESGDDQAIRLIELSLSESENPTPFIQRPDTSRDWVHVNDFWCGVPKLYTMTSAAVKNGK